MLCLSQIVGKDVLELIQVGMSIKIGWPLTVVEKTPDGWHEIQPFAQPMMTPFCDKCRNMLPGFRQACRESDIAGAERVYSDRWERPGEYTCFMGLKEAGVAIQAAGTPVAAFISGQVVYANQIPTIRNNIRRFWSRHVGRY